MILIINICKEKLHYYEFVKPVEGIIGKNFITKHYSDLNSKDLEKATKIIICGTSLKDDQFMNDLDKFSWLREFNKPVLGICGGMQLMGLIYGGKTVKKTEIGFFFEDFGQEFLSVKGKQEIYHLHNNFVDFSKDFEIFCEGDKIVQAVKHKEKEFYGVLFHPEVRQKEIIKEFISYE